jgi:hypothetical protein
MSGVEVALLPLAFPKHEKSEKAVDSKIRQANNVISLFFIVALLV